MLCSTVDDVGLELELFEDANEWHHDFGVNVDTLSLHVEGSLDDSASLHLGDFGICVTEAATTVTEHRVEFLESVANGLNFFDCDAHFLGELLLSGELMRNELMQWGIEKADCYAESVHSLEDAFKVGTLHREELGESVTAASLVLCNNHFAHSLDAVALEEHVLSAAKTDTLSTKLAGYLSVARRVGISADVNLGVFLSEVHDSCEVA